MIYICLLLICAVVITAALLIKKYSKRYKSAISFRESLDLTGLPVITFNQGKNKFNLLLDTGATNSVINSEYLPNLKHTVLEGTECEVYGIEGNVQTVPFVEIHFNRDMNYKGYFQVVDMSAAFNSVKEETGVTIVGILGNDFFQNYKYVLNYNTMIAYSKL